MDSNWVDFKTIKRAVTIEQVLVRYGVKLRRTGKDPGPSAEREHFAASNAGASTPRLDRAGRSKRLGKERKRDRVIWAS